MPRESKTKYNPYLDFYEIYLLSDPRDNQPFYIGQSKCAMTRLGSHIQGHGAGSKSLEDKIRELKRLYLTPTITILDITLRNEINKRESLWIRHYCDIFPETMLNINCLTSKEKRRMNKLKTGKS